MKWMKILKKHLSLKAVTVLLCGIIFSLSCGAMWVSKSFNLDCFYDVGRVHDIGYWPCITPELGAVYQGEGRKVGVTEDAACKTFVLEGAMQQWRTLVLELEDMNRDSMEWQLEFYDSTGILTGTQQVVLSPGENIVALGERTFNQMKVWIYNSAGARFLSRKCSFWKALR